MHKAHSTVKRRNATMACDPCRHAKTRCTRIPDGSMCFRCSQRKEECTYIRIQKKRGPRPRHHLFDSLAEKIVILSATSNGPCPQENNAMHFCHP
ncbi:10375_t:CDS:1, partial [Dentiscutata heterogama]